MRKLNFSDMSKVAGGRCEPEFVAICIDYVPPRPGICLNHYLIGLVCD